MTEPLSTPAAQGTVADRIREFFANNIGATRTECAAAIGVDRRTVWKHLKRMRQDAIWPLPPSLRECAEELADLVDDIVAGNYTPDSFTTQPTRRALALSASPSPEALSASGVEVREALFLDLLAFAADRAALNPTFAKGFEKQGIADARALVARAAALTSAPAPEDRT